MRCQALETDGNIRIGILLDSGKEILFGVGDQGTSWQDHHDGRTDSLCKSLDTGVGCLIRGSQVGDEPGEHNAIGGIGKHGASDIVCGK